MIKIMTKYVPLTSLKFKHHIGSSYILRMMMVLNINCIDSHFIILALLSCKWNYRQTHNL